jgi:hypothetical protein
MFRNIGIAKGSFEDNLSVFRNEDIAIEASIFREQMKVLIKRLYSLVGKCASWIAPK